MAFKGKNKPIIFYKLSNNKLKKIDTLVTKHKEEITKMNFSQSGDYLLTVAKDGIAKVWNINENSLSNSQLNFEIDHGEYIKDADFFAQDKFIVTVGEVGATGENEPVRFWHLSSGTEALEREITTKNQHINDISFNYQENYIAIAGDNGVCLWELSKSKDECISIPTENEVSIASFSHWETFSNMLATTGEDGIVSIWELTDKNIGRNIFPLRSSNNEVISDLSFAPNDSSLVTVEAGSQNNKVILWDLSQLNNRQSGFIYLGNNNSIDYIYLGKSINDRIRLIILNKDGSLELWELESKNLKSNNLPKKEISNVAVNPDKKHIAILLKNGNLEEYNLSNGREGLLYEGIPFNKVESMKYTPDGKRIAILEEGNRGYFIDLENNNKIDLVTHSEGNKNMAINNDGSYIVTLGQKGQVKLWKWNGEKSIRKEDDLASSASKILFSSDGKYLIIEDTKFKVELRTKETDFTLPEEHLIFENISSLAISFNGEYLALAQGGSSDNVSEIIFGKLSSIVSKEEDGWDELDTDIKLAKVDSNGHNLLFLPMNDKIRLIATAEENKTIHLWDLKGRELAVFKSDYGKIIDLKFTNRQDKETYLIAIEKDAQENINVQYWDINQKLDIEKLIQKSCKKLDQNSLSKEDIEKLEKSKLCAQ